VKLRERLAKRGLLERVEAVVAAHHSTIELVASRIRTTSVSRARKAVYKSLVDAGFSMSEVARLFGRDHSTIMSAFKGRSTGFYCRPAGAASDDLVRLWTRICVATETSDPASAVERVERMAGEAKELEQRVEELEQAAEDARIAADERDL
jgi:hypothetical protein